MAKRQTTDQIDMVPVEYRNGQPTRYVARDDDVRYPPAIGWDDDVHHVVSPVPADRLPRVQHIVQTDAIGEARAFNIRVSSLAAVLGGGVVLAALMFGASLSFWSALMWFGTVFALTWAGAFALDAMTSAGGVELFHAWRLWAHLDREQAHRHRRYDAPPSDRLRLAQTVLLALAAGTTVLAGLGLLVAIFAENMPR